MFMFWCNQQCCGSGSGQISTATFSEVRNFFPSRSRIDRSFSLINEEWKPRWLYKFVSRSLENKVEGEQNMGANSSVTNDQWLIGATLRPEMWRVPGCVRVQNEGNATTWSWFAPLTVVIKCVNDLFTTHVFFCIVLIFFLHVSPFYFDLHFFVLKPSGMQFLCTFWFFLRHLIFFLFVIYFFRNHCSHGLPLGWLLASLFRSCDSCGSLVHFSFTVLRILAVILRGFSGVFQS